MPALFIQTNNSSIVEKPRDAQWAVLEIIAIDSAHMTY